MGPVTTNPWLIALINMTIVFSVLASLGVLIMLIKMCDPTQKKSSSPAAPAAAPAAVAAAPAAVDNSQEIAAVIAAACAATGCSSEQVACVRLAPNAAWAVNARVDALNSRKECF